MDKDSLIVKFKKEYDDMDWHVKYHTEKAEYYASKKEVLKKILGEINGGK